VRELGERAYFFLSRALGRLLRESRYSTIRVIQGEPWVRKNRTFYAPFLISIGGPLVRILDTGVRVLPQREWEERERLMYQQDRGASIRVEADGTLVLPRLPGETLATWLENPRLDTSVRKRAIELAVGSLASLHERGFTHGDAMAENVMVDLDSGAARWFDFETLHDPSRPLAWRRADDVRALLATSLLRTRPTDLAATLQLILDVYDDEAVSRLAAAHFTSVMRPPLSFHLGQAGLSFQMFRRISGLLEERFGERIT
jgi:serine/threonine protein kinase